MTPKLLDCLLCLLFLSALSLLACKGEETQNDSPGDATIHSDGGQDLGDQEDSSSDNGTKEDLANNEDGEDSSEDQEELEETGDSHQEADSDQIEILPMPAGASWHWQLTEEVDPNLQVLVYDIDLFDQPQSLIQSLKESEHQVICYFSAGSWEDWRPDADTFPETAIGDRLDGWPGERWLDIRDPALRPILKTRLDLAIQKGCDGVEPDNIDGYINDTGFPLKAEDQLSFNRFLAEEAHARGLSIGLKNDVDQIEALVHDFDWALNESCLEYDECHRYAPFLEAGKAVLHVEYVDHEEEGEAKAYVVCSEESRSGFSTLVKKWDLDAWGLSCE